MRNIGGKPANVYRGINTRSVVVGNVHQAVREIGFVGRMLYHKECFATAKIVLNRECRKAEVSPQSIRSKRRMYFVCYVRELLDLLGLCGALDVFDDELNLLARC